MCLRVTSVAVLPGHRLALDDAGGIGARPDGPGPAMLGVAVRVRTTTSLVPLHDALEPATLRRPRHLHLLANREHADVHDVVNLVGRNLRILARRIVETERAQDTGRVVEPRLLRMTDLGAVRATSARLPFALLRVTRGPLLPVAELYGGEARRRLVRHLEDGVGRRLHDRDRDLLSLIVEHLGHTQLLADDADHCFLS